MKCYRLTKSAIQDVKNVTRGIFFGLILLLFPTGIVIFPLVLMGIEDNIIVVSLGVISWTALLSVALISFKRWLIANLEKC